MRYRLHIAPAAARAYDKLPERAQYALFDAITGLADNPRPPNSKDLRGNLKGLRSLRTGDYRTAYFVDERERIVYVRAVGHRERFYDILRRLQDEPTSPDVK